MLNAKLQSLNFRIQTFISQWGKRLMELAAHSRKGQVLSGWWWFEWIVRFGELGGLFLVYETLLDWIKWNTRPLTKEEWKLAEPYFGKNIRLDQVRLDTLSFVGTRQKQFAYVSFYTINYWKELKPSVLIHELVHIWHYEQLGAAYLVRALRGQWSREGYDYGGVEAIRGKSFLDFNLEQQAEIVMDFYRLQHGIKTVWGKAKWQDTEVYIQILSPHFAFA